MPRALQGSLHFSQCIKTKKTRFRKKLFWLCRSDPKLQGYILNICLYSEKDTYDVSQIERTENLSMPEEIPVSLAKHLLGQGREMVLDNWYTSVRLPKFFLSKNTDLRRTIRTNRVLWDLLTLPLLSKQSCFVRNNETVFVRSQG